MRILSLFLLLLSPLSVSAHGDSPSLEAEVGQYIIDIGYEELAPDTDIEFDVDLFLAGPPVAYADFASVDLRVTKDGAEVQVASIENDKVHVPIFVANFPESGGYDIDVRYVDNQGTLIVARTFHVEVPADSIVAMRDAGDVLQYVLAVGLFALSAGIAVYSIRMRFKMKK